MQAVRCLWKREDSRDLKRSDAIAKLKKGVAPAKAGVQKFLKTGFPLP
jgi:hypothetical protein